MATVIGKDQTATIRKTCHGCASVVEFTRSECQQINHSYDYLGDHETDLGIKCPSCGGNIFLYK